MREISKEEESEGLRKSNKNKSEESKTEDDGLTGILDETTPKLEPKPTPKQLEDETDTSVKSRVHQFAHKFSIPPIPPSETNRPTQPSNDKCGREPTELLQKAKKVRRPRENKLGDQDISCLEGKKTIEGNCKKTRDWWENLVGK